MFIAFSALRSPDAHPLAHNVEILYQFPVILPRLFARCPFSGRSFVKSLTAVNSLAARFASICDRQECGKLEALLSLSRRSSAVREENLN